LILPADLLKKFSFRRELEQHVVVDRDFLAADHLVLHDAGAGAGLAADPDVVLVVDEDTVLVLGPLVAGAGAAPRLDELSSGVEFHDRRCGMTLLVLRDKTRAVKQPDVIALVDGDRRHLTHHPVVRQLGRPRSIQLVDGKAGRGWRGRRRGLSRRRAHAGQENERSSGKCEQGRFHRHVRLLRRVRCGQRGRALPQVFMAFMLA
jgi:hypothetical protein